MFFSPIDNIQTDETNFNPTRDFYAMSFILFFSFPVVALLNKWTFDDPTGYQFSFF